ncbi:MAG: aminopeptidase [Anaerolineae bacterium]
MTKSVFEQNLKKYADLLVRIGVNITEGDLLHFSVNVTDDPNIRQLAHEVVIAAYEAGATYVDVEWRDEEVGKLRALHARDETLDYVPDWTIKKVEAFADAGVARLVLAWRVWCWRGVIRHCSPV